ncbi:excalibur calcium-binding domain-containing protein [Streptomyces prasinopilosus]|uniref:LPXTG-motif cell wall anchor domain-containing protein n=2 Tax=Streptomyces prasinopilosus TaxID=67344 RepID=A0A1G6J3F1_9ACTN|nr:excalibur calcium-binding domain-containing protein [Streptomyces prasinopilosus]SDC13189.1 LPXTG-motif cell wall anchor domain-containing protein [Streptomyces prasinopilosus]
MNLSCKSAAVTVAALALATLPVTIATAHEGAFENCDQAYAAGHAHIPAGSEHYGEHLDRDKDGIGCDKPPAGFVPADEKDGDKDSDSDDGATGTDTGTGAGEKDAAGKGGGTDLAETGGNGATPYLAAGGAAVVLVGGGVVYAARRRRGTD